MSLVLLPVPADGSPKVNNSAAAAGSRRAPGMSPVEAFQATLMQRIRAASVALKASNAPIAAAPSPAQLALEAKIAKMIDAGASQADIVSSLADRLTAQVAPRLDATGADAHAILQSVFAAALAPPGENGQADLSLAQRVRQLAHRFMKLEATASTLTGHPPPQPERTGQQNAIAGSFLDAHRAKDIPARTTTDNAAIFAGAPAPVSAFPVSRADTSAGPPTAAPADDSSAAAATRQAQSAAALQPAAGFVQRSATPAVSTASGDGRTVKSDKAAVATGGDTGLGRILTRAVAMADARAVTLAAAGTATASAAAPASAHADPALSAFLKAFEAALKPDSELQPAPARAPIAEVVPPAGVALGEQTAATVGVVAPPPAAAIDRTAGVAVPAPPTAAAPIDHSAIADQVLRGAFLRNVGQSSEMRLSLVPETLGDVSVKLVVNAGNVSAHVLAETPEVRDALVAAQPQLAKSLADAGLKLQSFNVDLSGNGFSASQQQHDSSRNGERGRRSTDSGSADGAADETALEAIPSFGPPITGGSNAGDLNHLA